MSITTKEFLHCALLSTEHYRMPVLLDFQRPLSQRLLATNLMVGAARFELTTLCSQSLRFYKAKRLLSKFLHNLSSPLPFESHSNSIGNNGGSSFFVSNGGLIPKTL